MVVGGSGRWRGATPAAGEDRCALPAGRIRSDGGQSLIIVVLAMTLVVALAAFSIDVGQWYVNRHHTQVSADAAALAAANCLASTKCTQTTSNGDAAGKADDIANANGFQTSRVTVTFPTNSTVKVTLKNSASSAFAGLFGISSVNTTQTATASFNSSTGLNLGCVKTGNSSCLSLFAGNDTCPSGTATNMGLSLTGADAGGGNQTMTGLFSNGYYYNGGDSGSYAFTSPSTSCGTPPDYEKKPNRTQFTSITTTNPVPYPAVWTKPTTCSFTASTFSTATIVTDGPGIYCLNATPAAGACTSSASGTGIVNAALGSLTAGGYEFVGACVILSGSNPAVTNITGQPLVYGTSNITTAATTTALPTCTQNDGSNGTSTWLDGNGSTIDAPIFDQCGTFESTKNSDNFTGFVEAWNIITDKNGAVIGDGPTSPTNPQVTQIPGTDALTN